VKTQGSNKVDPVERRLEEHLDCRGDDESNNELECEPDVADQLDKEESFVWIGLSFV